MEELTPPAAPRYEQLADILRRRIFAGTFPADASGPNLSRQYGISQSGVQKAFGVLAREGLLTLESGKRTQVPERQRWEFECGARLPAENAGDAAAAVAAALAAEAGGQPAVSAAVAERVGDGVRVRMTVESADLPGAVAVALQVAGMALGPFPIVVLSAREAAP